MQQALRVEIPVKENKLTISLYEYNINHEPDGEYGLALLESLLFECQCALIMLDVTNANSFKAAKDLVEKYINYEKYGTLRLLFVCNKYDQYMQNKIDRDELIELCRNHAFEEVKPNELPSNLFNICLLDNTDKNFEKLIDQMYQLLYKSSNELPINLLYEYSISNKSDPNSQIEKKSKNLIFRIILLGDGSVGKTSFLQRYLYHKFNFNTAATVGSVNDTKFFMLDDQIMRVSLWDTAGQEKYRSIPKNFYQNAQGILLLFSVMKNEQQSLISLDYWVQSLKENIGDIDKNSKNSPVIYLIANKIDDKDRVSFQKEAKPFIDKLGAKYFEISCLYDLNLAEVVSHMVFDCYAKSKGIKGINEYVNLNVKGKKGQGCC